MLGVSGPDGSHYFAIRMKFAAQPQTDGPMIKCAHGKKQPKQPGKWMGNIHDAVLAALAIRMSEGEFVGDSEIANNLSDEYGGGGHVCNAVRSYQLFRPPRFVKSEGPTQRVGSFATDAPSGAGLPFGDRPESSSCDDAQTPDSDAPPIQAMVIQPVPNSNPPTLDARRVSSPTVASTWTGPAPTGGIPNAADSFPSQAIPPNSNHLRGSGDAQPPIPGADDPRGFLFAFVYNMDRLANPGAQTKPGTIDGIKRNEEIWAYSARFSKY